MMRLKNIVWDSDNLGPFAFKVGILQRKSRFRWNNLNADQREFNVLRLIFFQNLSDLCSKFYSILNMQSEAPISNQLQNILKGIY